MLELPHQLGPYQLERLLGQGGMGMVYEAYDQRLERRVAIKRMVAGSDDPRRRERLRREARTTAQLAHPSIVQVFDLIEEDDSDWIVMELAPGTPLARRLASGLFDVDLALRYGQQIAEGLAAAHHLGIVHRDLKTENVMVLPDDRVKILDFGLAKRFDFLTETEEMSLSVTGEVMGTGRAMSPEQIRGLEVGPRSDLFSFGVLLYEVLSGVSPFRAQGLSATLQRVVTHQPKPVNELVGDVPQELSDLVDRLLSKAPELRPASAREVAGELAHLAETRRFEARRSAVEDVRTTAGTATLTATALLPESGDVTDAESGRSYARIRIGSRPSLRAVAIAASAALLTGLVIMVSTLRNGRPDAETSELGTVSSRVADDPLRAYEETMQGLRRVDQPDSAERAIETFQRMIERDGDSAAAHAGLARAYWVKGRAPTAGADPVFFKQSLAVAQEAVRLDAYLADARVSLGLAQLNQGHHDEGREQFETALGLDPANADAHYGLGKLAEALGRPEEAETHHRQAVERGSSPMYHNALGSFLYKRGRYEEAEEAFQASLSLAPDNVHALRNLGAIYYSLGRLDQAAAKFQSALKIRPTASLYANLGTIFFSRGLYSKAAAAFEDALSTGGATNRYVYWIYLADAYRQVPDKEDTARTSYLRAVQLLDEALEGAPDNVSLLSRRALVRSRLGDTAEASNDLKRIRALGTGTDLYALFRLAVSEELCGEREPALAHLEKALRSGFSLAEVRNEPDLLELRSDPRFHHLLVALDGQG